MHGKRAGGCVNSSTGVRVWQRPEVPREGRADYCNHAAQSTSVWFHYATGSAIRQYQNCRMFPDYKYWKTRDTCRGKARDLAPAMGVFSKKMRAAGKIFLAAAGHRGK